MEELRDYKFFLSFAFGDTVVIYEPKLTCWFDIFLKRLAFIL